MNLFKLIFITTYTIIFIIVLFLLNYSYQNGSISLDNILTVIITLIITIILFYIILFKINK
jgi:hypothetical protein